ncbi:MAG: sigma-70 family RNA polymerase sigma factor [Prevotella sp.]|nr:sigma-70 family RNA polymerase sigma factor [Prevotella sp.]
MTTRKQKLETLFRQHYRQMYRLASILLHDDAESKDIVHDVFAQLLASSAELHEDTAAAFLLTCVRNRCLNVIRSRRIQERVQRLYLLDLDTTIIPTDLFLEETKALTEGINLLAPPVCREVVELHFREGLTFREIALRLGVSETTVYKHLRHALQQLREHLKRD